MTICTPTKKARIWTLHQRGVSTTDIAKEFHVNRSTIHRVLTSLHKNPDFYAKAHRPGRPRKLSGRDALRAKYAIVSGRHPDAASVQWHMFPYITLPTIRRMLCNMGLYGRIRRTKPFLSHKHKMKRRDWAKEFVTWSVEEWKKVIFSDESRFNLFGSDGRQYCRRRVGEEFLDRNVNKVIKHGGGSLMVWGCITWNGPGQLWRVDKTLNAKQFCQILDSALIETLEDYKQDTTSIIFQQDNNLKHKSARA